MKTVLNQLEKWILDYEKVNGTPTMCEIKAQIEMFKEVEKQAESKQLNIHGVMCRTCSTCGHLKGSRCMLSGYLAITERTYPTVCGRNFEKWMPKPPEIGLKKRLLSLWYGT